MDDREPRTMTIPPDGRLDAEQPRWRDDFPIDLPQDEYVARRDFTKFMVLTSFAFAVGQLWIVAENFFRRRKEPLPVRERYQRAILLQHFSQGTHHLMKAQRPGETRLDYAT